MIEVVQGTYTPINLLEDDSVSGQLHVESFAQQSLPVRFSGNRVARRLTFKPTVCGRNACVAVPALGEGIIDQTRRIAQAAPHGR
ncbi:MAG TPA: hypothetical protein PLI18_02315 [Pirellulaceae bacterium]|nr:hypothetical protein [Pirellulaceae bacterium]